MSMLKNLKSLFIVEEETTPSKQKKAATGAAKSAAVPESKEGQPGKVSNKFVEVLFGAMEKNNQEGFDYLEFKQSLRSLEKMPMDETTRYQSALAMAQTMGANAEALIRSANLYVGVLQEEESKFEAAVAKQKEEQIGKKQEEIQAIEQTILSKAEQIKKLTQEIDALRDKTEVLAKDIQSATLKVETTKNDFIASYNTLVNQILLDVENMKKYLK